MQTATAADIKVGSTIQCNDPRYGWTVKVERIEVGRAFFRKPEGGRWISVSFNRIFTDGKARHQGYNLLDIPDSILRDRAAGIIA